MFKSIKNHFVFNEFKYLTLLTFFCFGLSVARFWYTGTKTLLFLNWNLFLAAIPWALSTLLIIKPRYIENKPIMFFTLFIWLLFFPNAPYILTDLFHIRQRLYVPMWFDLILILSFGWTGLMYGFFSLWHIEKMFQKYIDTKLIPVISSFLFFVTGFGIYLGRVLRWNSWDIISDPITLFYDIIIRFIHPLNYPNTWGMTILMGIFLNVVYWTFKLKTIKS